MPSMEIIDFFIRYSWYGVPNQLELISFFKFTYMIPPALPEIRQPVPERHLNQLKSATDDPGHLRISNYHHLEPPAAQVSYKVHVKNRLVDVVHARHRVLGREDAAIFGVVALGELLAEGWMEDLEHFAGLVQWQQQHEGHERGVGEEDAEEDAPEDGVRAADVGVGKLGGTECDDREEAKEDGPAVVLIDVRVAFVMEIFFPVGLYLVDVRVCQII